MLDFVAYALIAAASAFAIAAWDTDRRLQRYRAPHAPPHLFRFLPLRWRSWLYTPEGHPLVRRAWLQLAAMYALAIVGALFFMAGAP